MQRNQSGFSPLMLLMVVLVVVGISTAAWYVWQATTGSDEGDRAQPSAGLSKPANEDKPVGYLTIASKKVRLPLNETLAGVKAGKIGMSPLHASDQSVPIIVPALDEGWTCETNDQGFKGTIGDISISSQLKRSGPGDPAASKRIGDYTYGFEPGGQNCTTSEQYQKLVDAFKERFRLLESY